MLLALTAMRRRRRSAQLADLLLGNDALEFLGLALDPVAESSVRLDRHEGGDSINALRYGDVATLWLLRVEQHVVIDRVMIWHDRVIFSVSVDRCADPKIPAVPR
jgi:hypothetical protein